MRNYLQLMVLGVLMPLIGRGDIALSDIGVFSGWPWKEVVIGYRITGDNDVPITIEVVATDNATSKIYVCKTLEGVDFAPGYHVMKWNASADGAKFKSDDVIFTMRIMPQPPQYYVIDLTGGVLATNYPVMKLADVPDGGWTDEYKTTKLVLRRIEAGTFMMGDAVHGGTTYSVVLTKPYYIGVFEVTQRQWELVMGTRPSRFDDDACYASLPVEQVSYDMIRGNSVGTCWPMNELVDMTSFLGKLRARTGFNLDLPTEAQWEHACRAATTTDYNNGTNYANPRRDENMDTVGRYWSNGGNACDTATAKVGSYAPNAWGLYDMHGNVWEWCLDWYGGLVATTDPEGGSSNLYRVVRGGGWFYDASDCTSFSRDGIAPSCESASFGFRLSCSGEGGGNPIDGENSMEVLAEASSGKVPVDVTFEDGANVLSAISVAYGSVGDIGCEISANGIEIVNGTSSGSLDWALIAGGDNELLYRTGGMAMRSVVSATACSITFNANGGSVMSSTVTKWIGFTYGTLPIATRKGYKFLGWFTAVTGGRRVTADSVVDSTRTLYAHWEEVLYAVSFDANGGVPNSSVVLLREGRYGELPIVMRKGYEFLGWFTAADDGTRVTADSLVDSERTLYAHWQEIRHTIIFNSNGGSAIEPVLLQEGEAYGELPVLDRRGCKFLGWFTEAVGGDRIAEDTIVDAGRTLYAHWDRYCYNLGWIDGGRLDVCSEERRTCVPQKIAMDSAWGNGGVRAVVSVDGVEKAESRGADEFVWGGDETKEYALRHQVYDAQGQAVGEPYTAKIAWTSRAAVTFDGGNGEEAFSREYDKSYAYGELPSVTKTGHTFAGWYTAAEGGEKVEAGAQFDGRVSKLYAHWTVNQYGVKFDKNGGEGTAGDLTVAYGAVVPMEGVVFRKSGYRLAGWATAADGAAVYGQGGAMSNLTAEANGNVQLYAVWEPTTVDLKSFKQRYPWNGFVDVECEVGAEGRVGLTLIDEASGTNFTAKTLFCQGGSVTNSALWMVKGLQKFIWDAGSDLPDGFKTSKLKAKTYFVEGEE